MPVRERPSARSSAGRLAAINTAIVAERLLVTDDFWTAELARLADLRERTGQKPTDEDIVVLQGVAQDLQTGLAQIRPLATELQMMLDSDVNDEEVNEALSAVADYMSRPEITSLWDENLPDYSFRGAAIASCEYVSEEAPREANEIMLQLAALKDGSIPPGDLGPRIRCGLILVAASGALVGAIAGGAAAAVAGATGVALTLAYISAGAWSVSAIATGIYCWAEAKCPGHLPGIGRFRRA